jgi:hypothetical protein
MPKDYRDAIRRTIDDSGYDRHAARESAETTARIPENLLTSLGPDTDATSILIEMSKPTYTPTDFEKPTDLMRRVQFLWREWVT